MASKRKFCNHCKEFVTLRTYRLHSDLYSNRASDLVYSPEDEEISHDYLEDFNVDHMGTSRPGEMIDDQETKLNLQGLQVQMVENSKKKMHCWCMICCPLQMIMT